MAAFMDELRDCLANGWTVELGELGYFTPSLSCQRRAMEKDKVRAASVALRGLNFRLGKRFYEELGGKMKLERKPRPVVSASSDTFIYGAPFSITGRILTAEPLYQPCPICPPDGT